MEYKAIVSGHIFLDTDGNKHIEILRQVDNDDKGTEIFCDIDHALIDNIETGESDDYYFIAVIKSEFEQTDTFEGIEYDVNHYVEEMKTVEKFDALSDADYQTTIDSLREFIQAIDIITLHSDALPRINKMLDAYFDRK